MSDKVLICGAGPSINSNIEHWKRLGDFPGDVIVTDNSIARVIENFPDLKFYASTLEDGADLDKYYNPDIVKHLGEHSIIDCLLSDRVHPNVIKALKRYNIKYSTAAKCRDYMNTSNVGLFCYHIAREILNAKQVYLIGMDHSYGKGEYPPVERESELFQWGFYTLQNPYTPDEKEIVLHSANEMWREEFVYYAEMFPKVEVINCTGRGALYQKCFTWNPIEQMKNW